MGFSGLPLEPSSFGNLGGLNLNLSHINMAAPSPLRGPSTPLHALRDSLRSGGGGRGASQQGETRELVNSMRQRIVSNFQERMQVRRV